MANSTPSVGIRLLAVSAVFRHRERGELVAVDGVDLAVEPGELLTLLGPSGCGKTTILRMIAGFQEPSAGSILIGEHNVTRVPANRRDIGFVFQSYALFPHLTVFENVAYGLRVRHWNKDAIRQAVSEVLALVGLEGFAARLSNELSGGQQQRVALARAIVIRPRVLLFDEPLSNLDAKLRVEMRDEIRTLQRRLGITAVYVTHDQEEAMAISDRIAVMQAGQVAQLGSAEDLYRRPVSPFVASFIGRANMLSGTARGTAGETVTLEVAGQMIPVRTRRSIPVGAKVTAVVRPESVILDPDTDGLRATLVNRVYLGDKVEYTVKLGDETLQILRTDPPETDQLSLGGEIKIRLPQDGLQLLLGFDE